MGPSTAREMTFRQQQQQQQEPDPSQQQQPSTFAINVSPTKKPRTIESIEEQEESQMGSSPKQKKKRLSRREKNSTIEQQSVVDESASMVDQSDAYSVRSSNYINNYQSNAGSLRKQDTAAFNTVNNSSQQQKQRQFALAKQSKNIEASSQSSSSYISNSYQESVQKEEDDSVRSSRQQRLKQQKQQLLESKLQKINNNEKKKEDHDISGLVKLGLEGIRNEYENESTLKMEGMSKVVSMTSSTMSLHQRDPSPSKSVKQNKQAQGSVSKMGQKSPAIMTGVEQITDQNNITMQYASNSQPHKLLSGSSSVQDSYGSQRSGGAASSKKGLQMSQVVSKQGQLSTNEFIEDDKVPDPDSSQIMEDKLTRNSLQQQQNAPNQGTQPLRGQRNVQQTSANSNAKTSQPYDQQQYSNPNTMLPHMTPVSPLQQQFYPYPLPNSMMHNGFYPPPPMQQFYYQSQPYSQLDETNTIPSQLSNTQNMYMASTGYMYPTPAYSSLYDPNMPLSAHQGQQAYLNQHVLNHEQLNDYLMFNDSIDHEFGGIQQQNLGSSLPIMYASAQETGSVPQYAIVLEDYQCQLKGELMVLYEGDKVEIVKLLPEIKMAQVKFNNEVGLFPIAVLKIIKRNQMSPEKYGYNSHNGSKPRVSEVYQQKQMTPDIRGDKVMKGYESQRDNFFKQTLEPSHKQNNDILQGTDATQSSSNLKLHERMQRRKDRKTAKETSILKDL